MTSFIISAKNQKERDNYIQKFITDKNISQFDVSRLSLTSAISASKTDTKSSKQSIGIEDLKSLQHAILLKPIQSKEKLILIDDAHFLTPEAQNALLKTLEEPPMHTYILLSVESQEALLPTILSRCTIIDLSEKEYMLSEKEKKEVSDVLEGFPHISIGEALSIAEGVAKNKTQAVVWLRNMILMARTKILKNIEEGTNQEASVELLRQLEQTHKNVKTTNINLRLAIEDLLISQTH